jgi:hypothetical protein
MTPTAKGVNIMAKFQLGDTVKIRKEWKDKPDENYTYRVVNVNDHTNRYYIECLDIIVFGNSHPQELVSEEMIEKVED